MAEAQVALVVQGGGALGAYQGGAFTGLAEHGFKIDWVVGTSIGAINGAIIAGNRPEERVEKLKAFWEYVAQDEPSHTSHLPHLSHLGTADWMRPIFTSLNSSAKILVKPRFGRRRYRGICPPSKPLIDTPEREV